jgi:hypothetical protein
MSLLLEQLNDESIEMVAILLVQNQISTTIKTQAFIITKKLHSIFFTMELRIETTTSGVVFETLKVIRNELLPVVQNLLSTKCLMPWYLYGLFSFCNLCASSEVHALSQELFYVLFSNLKDPTFHLQKQDFHILLTTLFLKSSFVTKNINFYEKQGKNKEKVLM